MNFASYILFVASNMGAILFLPNDSLREFLGAYSTASLVVGIVIVFLFSQGYLNTVFQKMKKPTIAILWGIFLISCIFKNPFLLAISYALALLLGDYVISQGCTERQISVYRFSVALTIIPCLLGWQDWIHYLIEIRILVAQLYLSIYGRGIATVKKLGIRSAFAYVAATSFFYYGLLMYISVSTVGYALKGWYVGTQIGLGLQLKLMDFEIRKVSSIPSYIRLGIYTSAAILPLVLVFLYSGWLNLIFYSIATMGLYLTLLYTAEK